jgi:hypothetical protein
MVVPATGERWDTTTSVRIDDHPEPLQELRRLITLSDAHDLATQASELLEAGDHTNAALLFDRACELAPDSDDLLFRAGVSFARMGDVEAGVQRVGAAIEMQPNWTKMLDRLPTELAPVAVTLLARLNR